MVNVTTVGAAIAPPSIAAVCGDRITMAMALIRYDVNLMEEWEEEEEEGGSSAASFQTSTIWLLTHRHGTHALN